MKATPSDKGIVYLVGAGPGDPGLITVRGMECLQQADVVIYDRLANPKLLAYACHAELIDAGKEPDRHAVPQGRINALLVEHARAGKVVVRLKGGDPFVFGRGGEEAEVLAEAGVRFAIVPGVTSAVAAPAYAGIPVTYRDLACSFTVITGHRAACIDDPTYDWRRLAQNSDTLVFLMGVRNLPHIVQAILDAGRPATTPVALVEQATTAAQRTVVGTLADITTVAADIEPPAVIIVGEVVRLREKLNWCQ
jgi:uroporphyrinogen III methyltransferase / synthase